MNRAASLKDAQPYTWSGTTARFTAEGVPFEVEFKAQSIRHPTHGPITGFRLSFYKRADKDTPWQYKMTGEGKAFQILATVGAILRDFLTTKKPAFVWFVADEPSRTRLYDVLIQKMRLPGYVGEITADGKYTLRRLKIAERVAARWMESRQTLHLPAVYIPSQTNVGFSVFVPTPRDASELSRVLEHSRLLGKGRTRTQKSFMLEAVEVQWTPAGTMPSLREFEHEVTNWARRHGYVLARDMRQLRQGLAELK